jgi:hypothetical protein
MNSYIERNPFNLPHYETVPDEFRFKGKYFERYDILNENENYRKWRSGINNDTNKKIKID